MELLILDDADDPSFQNDIAGGNVHYWRDSAQRSIPEKLNSLCSLASGETICRFDSDDWSAPERVWDQAARLRESRLSVTGYHSMLFIDEEGHCAKFYGEKKVGWPNYILGTSMMFLRSYWADHPFDETKRLGSDNVFARTASELKQSTAVDAGALMFARVHSENSNRKDMDRWSVVTPEECAFALAVEGREVQTA